MSSDGLVEGLLEGEPSSSPAASVVVAATAASAAAEDAASPWASFIKSIVFGGLDGIVTTFAIIASVEGASFPTQVVLLTGFAKVLGDGLAMGIGDAMSESAEQQGTLNEAKREAWEYEHYAEGGAWRSGGGGRWWAVRWGGGVRQPRPALCDAAQAAACASVGLPSLHRRGCACATRSWRRWGGALRAWRLTPPPRWRPRAEKREMIEIYCQKGLSIEVRTRGARGFRMAPLPTHVLLLHRALVRTPPPMPTPSLLIFPCVGRDAARGRLHAQAVVQEVLR